MGLLTQLQPLIQPIQPPRKSALDIATELATATKLAATPRPADQTKCPNCHDTSFWLPVGSKTPMCLTCSPAPSQALVAKEFFYDDLGGKWKVERNPDGTESYAKE